VQVLRFWPSPYQERNNAFTPCYLDNGIVFVPFKLHVYGYPATAPPLEQLIEFIVDCLEYRDFFGATHWLSPLYSWGHATTPT
jgi:hypothetical protein